MAPNVFVDTGAHFPLTLSLTGGGVINQASLGPLFTAQPHTNAGYTNPPTGFWNDAVAGNCGSGGSSGGCGSTMSFLIDNFGGFVAATQPFQGFQVYAAADILLANCTGGCTGVVAAPGILTPTLFSAVPGPVAGAGLPGLLAACFGLFFLARRRRHRHV